MISFKNMRQFDVDLDAFANKLGIARKTVYRKVTVDLWTSITFATPVDTGRARASWNIASGTPDPSVPDEGVTFASPPQLDTAEVGKITGETVVWITSNLPYIEPLEHGHSKQAPIGMVMVSVAEVVARIQLYNEQTITQ